LAVLQEFKCPCCDGAIEFDSDLQKMKCPYCDSEFEVETLKEYDRELNEQPADNMEWDTSGGRQWQEGEEEGLRVYCCNTCGGEIVTDETTGAADCPYCGNPVIMQSQFSGSLKPDLVLPFKLDKKDAEAALKKHYGKKKLLPKIFRDENRIKEVKGIYVPFWLFDADVHGHVRYKAARVRTWSDSHYDYTETSYFSVTRAGGLSFANIPVDGSSRMDDILMESIEPFDISEAVDFQTAYLSGYLANRYDVDAEQSVERANERIRRSAEDAFASTVTGYTSVVPVNTSFSLDHGQAKYVLYPVWLLNTEWEGNTYTFAMNGQTGKFVGDLPVDKKAFRRWLFGLTGAIGGFFFILSFLLWLL